MNKKITRVKKDKNVRIKAQQSLHRPGQRVRVPEV
jgi:hypothetical protein